jgi:putative lysine transport system substrate-binding protein/putative lysine transport system permease protein
MLTVLLGAPVALVKAIDRANRRVFFMKPNKRRLIALLAGAASLLISCGNQSNGDVIRIGLECAYVPFNWVAEESEYTLPIANHAGSFADGYDIQIAKKISSELGKKVEIVQTKWESLITDLQMGAIDAIVAGMTDTEERRRQISFTEEYYRSELVLVTAEAVAARYESPLSASEFGSLVNGQNIVSQVSTVTNDVIDVFASQYGARHVTPVATFALAAQDVVNGSAFAMTAELPVATSIVGKLNGLGIVHFDQEVLGETQSELGVSIGVRKNDTDLLSGLNSTLAKISKAERESLMGAAIARSGGAE